ncbi:MAG TPA: type IV pilus assembly protein PilM [Candidatus Methylomirabilis sp.]|nr:type IV pilus assembly protein PilM [Candidatus Methylomirabilis sp.]
MGLFSKTTRQSYIGVDLGMSGVKIVELLNEKGRARMVTYAYADYPDVKSERSYTENTSVAGDLLKRMIAQAKMTTKKTIGALPIASVFSSIISVPGGNEKEVKEAINWQAKKLIPMPLEEISLDSKILDAGGSDEKKKVTRVLLTGAPTAFVTKYVEILTNAGLEPLALETEAFAQIRSLVGKDRSTVMVVDIGALRTNLTVVEKGIPFLSRSIASGGVGITTTIAGTLGIPYEQAEIMKRDIKAMQAFAPTGDLSPILQTLLKPILDEIKYSFNLYQGQSEGGVQKRIEKIIVTGGSAMLPRLPEFLTQLMNVNTYLGDPWARVVYPEDLRPVLEEIGSRFAVAVGCAMRDIE